MSVADVEYSASSRDVVELLRVLRRYIMVKHTGPTNPELQDLIAQLRKIASEKKVKLWRRIAAELERPARLRRVVNLEKIDRVVRDKEIALVPGKVLGNGSLQKNVKVAAFQFSESAKSKLKDYCTIAELLNENPHGKKVRIVG